MSIRISRQVHRWSRLYPALWWARNGVAVEGTLLDRADAERRANLLPLEQLDLVLGGIRVRVDTLVDPRTRDLAAMVNTAALGVYAFVTGVLLEWAPWGSTLRASVAHGDEGTFGPFLSPFGVVALVGLASWLLTFVGPTWLWRASLGATVVGATLLCLGIRMHLSEYPAMHGTPTAFLAALALLALGGRRPSKGPLLAASLLWLAALAPAALFSGTSNLRDSFDGLHDAAFFFTAIAGAAPICLGALGAATAGIVLGVRGRGVEGAAILLSLSPWLFAGIVTTPALLPGGLIGTAVFALFVLAAAFVCFKPVAAVFIRDDSGARVKVRG